jgi:hypothetical protein
MNDEVLDTDYASAITRQWHKVVDDLADARARKADLGVLIKGLVVERQKLVPLVRLVAPGLLERNGDVDG